MIVFHEGAAAGTNRQIHRFFNLSEYPVHQRNIDGLWERVKITMSRYSVICIADPGKHFRVFDSPPDHQTCFNIIPSKILPLIMQQEENEMVKSPS